MFQYHSSHFGRKENTEGRILWRVTEKLPVDLGAEFRIFVKSDPFRHFLANSALGGGFIIIVIG
jgi:hypothetical protein